jgi:pimeloyl-ACP methyl ester carboxylesterase
MMDEPVRTISLSEVQLNVYEEGEGPVVLLLHGFPDSHALWRKVSPLLLQYGFRVIAPDLRGFGESSAPRGRRNYRMDRVAADLLELLDELGLSRVHVVGHDWGAVIAWILASKHPERCLSLTALSVGHPTAYARAGWEQKRKGWYTLFFQLRGIAEWFISRNDFAFLRKWARGYPETDKWISELSRPGRLTAGLNWYRANLVSVLFRRQPNCPVPTMGIWSDRDMALSEDQMKNSVRYVDSEWRYERLTGLSHWIPLEAPEEVARLISEFVESLPASD